MRKLKTLTQQDGEEIRQYAIRVRDELKKIRGHEPRDQEWRDEVMVGALDATAMELDRVTNQMPGDTGFWDVIKAVEYWERQNAALLNQGDPHSAIRRSSAQGAAVLLADSASPGKDPSSVHGAPRGTRRGHLHAGTSLCSMLWALTREKSRRCYRAKACSFPGRWETGHAPGVL